MHLQLVLHLVVVSEDGLLLGEVLAVLVGLLDARLQLQPLLAKLLHHFVCLHRLLVGELVAILRFLFVPFVEHFLKIRVQRLDSVVQFLDETTLLLLNFVLEGGEAGIEVLPHGLDLAEVHGGTFHLLDHLVFHFNSFVHSHDTFFLDAELDCVGMHFFNFFHALRVSVELLKTLLNENSNNFSVLFNRVFEGVGESIFEASEK